MLALHLRMVKKPSALLDDGDPVEDTPVGEAAMDSAGRADDRMNEPEEVIEEIRRTRERIADRFDNALRKFGEYLEEYQKKFGDRLILPPERKNGKRPAA